MNDRLLFYAGLKEKIERTEEEHRDYLAEGYTIENHFAFGLYEFRGLLEPLYEQGDVGKLADYFELLGTANRSLYWDHSEQFWWIYPPLVWLLCSAFYHYRTGRTVYAANLARLNYSYMEESKKGLRHGFTNIPIGDTERGMFEELMGYFSLLFDQTRFETHMREAKRLIEQHANFFNEINEELAVDLDENAIVHEYTYDQAQGALGIALFLCFEINEGTLRFADREQIFDRLKAFFAAPPDWEAMRKPSLRKGNFDIMSPYQ